MNSATLSGGATRPMYSWLFGLAAISPNENTRIASTTSQPVPAQAAIVIPSPARIVPTTIVVNAGKRCMMYETST